MSFSIVNKTHLIIMKAYIVFALLLASVAFAHMEAHTPEEVMSEMMGKQGVAEAEKLDCSRISGMDFEVLGDAVIERMAGSEELHEQMDAMMGAEGSGQMHIAMGRNWLGCSPASGSSGMMPMMMRMMGNYYPGYYSRYDFTLLLAAAGWVLFLASVVYFYHKKSGKRR